MTRGWMNVLVAVGTAVVITTMMFATTASASGELELGGRTAATANFSVLSNKPDDFSKSTTVILGATLTRSSADVRFEYGAGLSVAATLSDFVDVTLVTPSGQVRINSNLMGPEENILLYAGFLAGVTFIEIDASGNAGGEKFTDEVGAFGPKFGAEYYFSSNLAIQLEDTVVFDTEKGVTNNLTLGVKLLF